MWVESNKLAKFQATHVIHSVEQHLVSGVYSASILGIARRASSARLFVGEDGVVPLGARQGPYSSAPSRHGFWMLLVVVGDDRLDVEHWPLPDGGLLVSDALTVNFDTWFQEQKVANHLLKSPCEGILE